jgi:oligopeptide/dipeptide ABC transporter ATP-binding protein
MAVLLITHDLGVVAETCSRLLVMYAGRIVETSPAAEFFTQQCHPYGAALLRCLPQVGAEQERLFRIEGSPPDPIHLPPGCRFAPRCHLAQPRCAAEDQVLLPSPLGPQRSVACWRAEELLEQERRHVYA